MSRPAVSWVIENSPYRGPFFAIHLIVADRVDGDGVLRTSRRVVAERARSSRHTVDAFIERALADGFLRVCGKGPNGTTDFLVVLDVDGDDPRPKRKVARNERHTVAQNGRHPVAQNESHPVRTGGAPVALEWRSGGSHCAPQVALGWRSLSAPSLSFSSSSPSRGERAENASPATAAHIEKRDEHSSKDEDPAAARLAVAVGAPYKAALRKLTAWREAGAGDSLIDRAIGYAADHGGRSPAYVETLLFDWMARGQPDDGPTVQPDLWVRDDAVAGELRWEVGPRRRRESVTSRRELTPTAQRAARGHELAPTAKRDRVVDVVYFALDSIGLDDALSVVIRLRSAGVDDDHIAWAAGKAVEVGGPGVAYLEAVARARAGVPGGAPAGNGHAPKVLDLTDDEGVA